jgi:hypothetical protein
MALQLGGDSEKVAPVLDVSRQEAFGVLIKVGARWRYAADHLIRSST